MLLLLQQSVVPTNLLFRVAASELLYPTGCVYELTLTGVKRVVGAVNF